MQTHQLVSGAMGSDPMQALVNDQFCKIFGVDDSKAIEDATVYVEKLLDNGSRVKTRYSGKDVNLVVKRAICDVESIDTYRSPKRSAVYQHQGGFACDVTYYGLD